MPTVAFRIHEEWYASHNCDHAHCPDHCEHPQPILLADGRLICGRCAIRFHETVEMVPCTVETCKE
jgi:hypothetical protein